MRAGGRGIKGAGSLPYTGLSSFPSKCVSLPKWAYCPLHSVNRWKKRARILEGNFSQDSPGSHACQVHLYIVLPIDKNSITRLYLESAMHFSQAPRLAMRTITGYLSYGFYRWIFSLSLVLIYLYIFILPLWVYSVLTRSPVSCKNQV